MHPECLLFLHIPKTGGTSLRTAIRWQYRRVPPSRIIRFDAPNQPLEEIERVPIELRTDAKLIMGHFSYGIHNYIPQRCSYVTLLRHPVPRLISRYKHIVRNPKDPLHEIVTDSYESFEQYLGDDLDKKQIENSQTRQVSGIWDEDPDSNSLSVAKANLSCFLAVGLMERFDESLILFRRVLDWGLPLYLIRNTARTSSMPVTDKELDLIHRRNTLDLDLYDHAQQLFERLVAEQGPWFQPQVRAARAANRLFGIVESKTPIIRRVLRSRSPGSIQA